MDKNIFYETEGDPSDLDVYEQFRLLEHPEFPYIVGEKIIPRATRSGASIKRNTRCWEMDEFEAGSAPPKPKEAFKRLMEARGAPRP